MGQEYANAINSLPALYPELRSLRLSIKHDPKWFGLDTRYQDQKARHEVAAWEARRLLEVMVHTLRSIDSPRTKIREVHLDQNTYFDMKNGPVRRIVSLDTRDMSDEEVVMAVMDLPHCVARV